MEKSKALQTSKVKRFQYHISSFATNAKGTSLSKTENTITRKKKIMNGKPHG